MPNQNIAVANINAVIAREVLFPTVMVWNRLEGRPRKTDFTRALRAEVRDPLWMITKQWQVGELRGDDAGSPVFARAHLETAKLDRYRPGRSAAGDLDETVPLEAAVERRPVPFATSQHLLSLDVRLLMGRQWIKLLGTIGLGGLAAGFVAEYAIDEPDPAARADANLSAHVEVWQHFAALAGRAMDGGKLYAYLVADPANRHAYDRVAVPSGRESDVDAIADRFIAWFDKLFYQPAKGEPDAAWMPSQLEYQFAVSAANGEAETVLTAEEYYHGRLDWYCLDVDASQDSLGPGAASPAAQTRTFIPTTVQFEGMPNTRWWTFEDGKTSFGDVKPDTTDINKLLLMEFGLVYANDWFIVPFDLPVGTVARVGGLAVTNVFGERTWIEASGSRDDERWQRWSMFQHSVTRGDAAEPMLVLLPTVPKIGEGRPAEEIYLIRDEISNMVWGIEKTIPLPNGASKPGREAAAEIESRYRQILDAEIDGGLVVPAEPERKAAIWYQLMTRVPENWIPFIPVHKEADNREIQLQRASMPRIIPGDPNLPEKIKPRTVLMRHGLNRTPAEPYFIHEEEVPRAGVRVVQSYQRTRWHDGSVVTWLGIRKQTGRGEGSSGLAFDQVKPVTAGRSG